MTTSNIKVACVLFVFPVLVGCGGGGGGLGDPGLSNVKVEISNARAATITTDGGKITATGKNGIVYTLNVPPDAVERPTRIAMYPVLQVSNLGQGGPAVGGVNFAPNGLQLIVPATLTIQLPPSIDPLDALPITYTGNADTLNRDMGAINGHTITLKVYHFSGTVLAGRDIWELLPRNLPDPRETAFLDRMGDAYIHSLTHHEDDLRSIYTGILHQFGRFADADVFDDGQRCCNGHQDQLAGPTVEKELRDGIKGYTAFLDAVLFAQITLNDPSFNVEETSSTEPDAILFLKAIYVFYNNLCAKNKANPIGSDNTDDDPLADAETAMSRPIALANLWHINRTTANGLDTETLLNNLCVKVVIEEKSFTGSEQGTFSVLKVRAGFTIAGGSVRHDNPIKIKISGNGTSDPTQGTVNNGSAFSPTVHWPNGVNPLHIDILASLFRDDGAHGNALKDIAVFDRITVTDNGSGGGGGGGGNSIFGKYDGNVIDESPGGGPGGSARIYLTQVGGFVGVEIQAGSGIGPPTGAQFTATVTNGHIHADLEDTVFDGTISGTQLNATMTDKQAGGDKFHYIVTRSGP